MNRSTEQPASSAIAQSMPSRQPDVARQPAGMTLGVRIATVIVNWNRREDTLVCLKSLRRAIRAGGGVQAVDVILVDNGSTDGTVEAVKAQYPKAHVDSLPENLGFAAGCNVGIRHALASGSDYILLINNDTVVAPDMVEHLVAAAETHSEAGLLSPVIYRFDEPERVWSLGHRKHAVTVWQQPPTDELAEGKPFEVDWLVGCGMLIRRRVLEEVGLFDDHFFMYYEDFDLCERARQLGFKLLIVPDARMWHQVGASTGEESPLRRYHLARSSVLFHAKHAHLPFGPAGFVYRLAVTAIRHLGPPARHGRWDVVVAYLRGLLHGLRELANSPQPSMQVNPDPHAKGSRYP